MNGGIRLDIDDNGEVQVIEDDQSDHYCLAGMTCRYANRIETEKLITITCNYKNKIKNVFEFKHCPAKKWHRYENHFSPEIKNKPGCYNCGSTKQWRLRGNKKNKWICSICHPPAYKKDQIIIDDTSAASD